MIRAERKRPADRIAAAVIGAVTVAALGGTWFLSDARQTQHHSASAEIAPLSTPQQAPDQVQEVWRAPTLNRGTNQRPLVVDGAVVTETEHGISVLAADTGVEAWNYSRQRELCGTAAAWNKVVTVFRGPAGCGDVVSFDHATGKYEGTRSAVSSENVSVISSNSRIGTVSDQRLELWRSDLVRTVEYGRVESPNEPKAQPRSGCRIHSALTRTDLLAVVDTCPSENGNVTSLRFSDTTPEDSRVPEEKASVDLGTEAAVLVAIGQEAAVVYTGGDRPMLKAIGSDGTVLSETKTDHSPAADEYLTKIVGTDLPDRGPGQPKTPSQPAFLPATADLPHHMTWFDGQRLRSFAPVRLQPSFVVDNALGPGAFMGSEIIIPVPDGLLIADKTSGKTKRTIKLSRGDYRGPVSLAVAGSVIVEQRGAELVALRQN